MFIFGGLMQLAFLGLIIYGIVKVVSRRRDASSSSQAEGGVRRLFVFGTMFVALQLAAWGLVALLALLSERGFSDVGERIATPLALTIVAVPVFAGLARWAWVSLADPAERGPALSLYLNLTLTVALVTIMVTGVITGLWVAGGGELEELAAAGLVVWMPLWVLHWLAWRRYQTSVADIHLYVGSGIGLYTVATFGGILVTRLMQVALDAGTTIDLVSLGADELRLWIVGLAVGACVFAWYWLVNLVSARRDGTWHSYVILFGVLGGLVAAVSGAGFSLFALLQWWFGDPVSESAVRHFRDFTPALAALVVGLTVWFYHRLVLGEAAGPRMEVQRVYDYVLAGVGLVTATVGTVILVIGFQEALFPPDASSAIASSADPILGAITALVVGAPIWAAAWRRCGRHLQVMPEEEASSPTRRVYLFGTMGIAAVVAFGSLIVLFIALFEEVFGAADDPLRDTVQVPIALLVAVGAVAGYHWLVVREERSLVSPPVVPKEVLLVAGDLSLAGVIEQRTGAHVVGYHRLDANGDGPDPEDIAAAVAADSHERLLVVTGAGAAFEVIPYER